MIVRLAQLLEARSETAIDIILNYGLLRQGLIICPVLTWPVTQILPRGLDPKDNSSLCALCPESHLVAMGKIYKKLFVAEIRVAIHLVQL
jgi:hypothetical protein